MTGPLLPGESADLIRSAPTHRPTLAILPTVTAPPRACQRPTRSNRITAPHVVPIKNRHTVWHVFGKNSRHAPRGRGRMSAGNKPDRSPRILRRETSSRTVTRHCNTGRPPGRCESQIPAPPPIAPLTVTLTAFLFWGFLPLLLLIAVIDCLTMSQPRRVRMLRRSGMTQAAIADRLQISRYRVRLALA